MARDDALALGADIYQDFVAVHLHNRALDNVAVLEGAVLLLGSFQEVFHGSVGGHLVETPVAGGPNDGFLGFAQFILGRLGCLSSPFPFGSAFSGSLQCLRLLALLHSHDFLGFFALRIQAQFILGRHVKRPFAYRLGWVVGSGSFGLLRGILAGGRALLFGKDLARAERVGSGFFLGYAQFILRLGNGSLGGFRCYVRCRARTQICTHIHACICRCGGRGTLRDRIPVFEVCICAGCGCVGGHAFQCA